MAFADDFKLCSFQVIRDSSGTIDGPVDLQHDLNSILERSSSWNMKPNPKKCVSMRFGKTSDAVILDRKYFISGEEVKFVSSCKDLGITVDKSLKFHVHVGVVVGRAGAMMGELLRSTVCRSKEFMIVLYVSHIRPILDYCSSVWNVGYLGDLRRLEAVQRRWTREVSGFSTLDYGSRLRELNLHSIYGRLLRGDLIKMWKVFHSHMSADLSGLFHLVSDSRTRGHAYKLAIPVCRTELLRRSFGVRHVMLWNSLPAEVVETESLTVFKSGLARVLSEKLFEFL